MFEIKNLKAGYSHQTVINNLSFTLPKYSFLAIIGHNGSGKSTLLKAVTNQIYFEGEIYFDSVSVKEKRKKLLATLNQQNNLKFPITVKDLVVMGKFTEKSFFESYDDKDYLTVDSILKILNIEHLIKKDFTNLSGGEQQMVWLAQMMIQNSEYFLLDEPTQSLDLYNKKRVFKIMADWVNIYKKTVICITHDLQNLYGMNGFLFNISKKNPALEILNQQSIDDNKYFLENTKLERNY